MPFINKEDPAQSDPFSPNNFGEKTAKISGLQTPLRSDSLESWPIVTKKTETKIQERSIGMLSEEWLLPLNYYTCYSLSVHGR